MWVPCRGRFYEVVTELHLVHDLVCGELLTPERGCRLAPLFFDGFLLRADLRCAQLGVQPLLNLQWVIGKDPIDAPTELSAKAIAGGNKANANLLLGLMVLVDQLLLE